MEKAEGRPDDASQIEKGKQMTDATDHTEAMMIGDELPDSPVGKREEE